MSHENVDLFWYFVDYRRLLAFIHRLLWLRCLFLMYRCLYLYHIIANGPAVICKGICRSKYQFLQTLYKTNPVSVVCPYYPIPSLTILSVLCLEYRFIIVFIRQGILAPSGDSTLIDIEGRFTFRFLVMLIILGIISFVSLSNFWPLNI